MQVVQRMDLDQHEADHHPIKPLTRNRNSLQGENANCLKQAKGGQGRTKRAFGKDLTNQQRQTSNLQQINVQKSGFNLVKPQIIVKQKANENTDDMKHKDAIKEMKKNLSLEMDELHSSQHDNDADDIDDEDDDIRMITIKEQELAPWDHADIDDDIHVTDYVNDIMQNLRNDEVENFNGCVIEDEHDYMNAQKDINQRMRTVLVDWIIEVHRKFKLLPSTYFLGVNLLDRFLAKKQIHRRKLQLAGCTCLWVASKYHEIYAPEMADFVYISDNAFSTDDLMAMEIEILKTLSFTLTVPTVLNYVQRYTKISSFYLKKEREKKIISDLIMYCTENCVMSYNLCRKLPSELGAACFVYSCIATKVFSTETFKNDNLGSVVGYTLDQLIPAMQQIHSIVRNSKKSKHKAVYKKYSNQRYSNIGKLNFDKLNTGFLNL